MNDIIGSGAQTEQSAAETARHEIERKLTLLIEASAALLASPESQEVLKNIISVAKRFIDADGFAVWRRTPGEDLWRMVAMTGLSESYSKVQRGPSDELAQGPLVIEDTQHSLGTAQLRTDAYEAEGIRSCLAVPAKVHGQLEATLAFYYRRSHRFSELEIRVASALGNLAGAALGTADLYTREAKLRARAEQEEKKALFLAEAGQLLASSLDYEATLKRVAEMAVPSFADLTAVDLVEPSGEVRRVTVYAETQEKIASAYEFREHFPPREQDVERVALRTGKAVLIEDIRDEVLTEHSRGPKYLEILRSLGPKSLICAPLSIGDRRFGVISFLNLQAERRYTVADLAFAEELALRAARAVENARLFTASQASENTLKVVNDELRTANENLNQFAYSASHDLQEPLRILSIYSQLMERDFGQQLDGRAREYLGFLVESSRRLQMLLRDLLAYIQVTGTKQLEETRSEAQAVLEKVMASLARSIAESQAEIHYEKLPALAVEEVHLLLLLQNLVENAIKYRSSSPPRLYISAERTSGEKWLMHVRDNGIGIPARYHAQVFGMFKRLHTREQYPGTGIGLAICQRVVERYGGKIWVESQEGAGSTFFFTLPAWKESNTAREDIISANQDAVTSRGFQPQ